jgi:hypothetical protein
MIVYVDNTSSLDPDEVRHVIRALNTQVARDFAPIWGLSAKVTLLNRKRGIRIPPDGRVGVVHLMDTAAAVGWHLEQDSGIPAGYVRADLSQATRSNLPWMTWTSNLSHEVLELVADPFLNLFARGPHPKFNREVFYYREVCDPVQASTYKISGVTVSNFVLPHFYNAMGDDDRRNDFLSEGVKPFSWLEQGYVGFWDPRVPPYGRGQTYPKYAPKHPVALALKAKGELSRPHRYALPAGHVRHR